MIFLYANYYFNFGFNVTCITNQYNSCNKLDKTLLKSPSHIWNHYIKERQNIKTLRSYDWKKAVGLGVVLGYNNLRALDIDDCEDFAIIQDFLKILELPLDYKWLVQSGSKKGFHIIFYADNHKYKVQKYKIKAFKSNTTYSDKLKHVELRWLGHLVLPPSIHPSLMNYQFLNGFPFEKPSVLELDNLHELLKKYCFGKDDSTAVTNYNPLEKSNEAKYENMMAVVLNTSGIYIDEDEDDEPVRKNENTAVDEFDNINTDEKSNSMDYQDVMEGLERAEKMLASLPTLEEIIGDNENNHEESNKKDIISDKVDVDKKTLENIDIQKDNLEKEHEEIYKERIKIVNTLNEFITLSHRVFFDNEPSTATKFEIMIYTEFRLLQEIHFKIPAYYEILQTSTNIFLDEWAKKNNIIDKLPCDLNEFINNRFKIYFEELGNQFKIPFNILRNFYGKPLLQNALDINKCDYTGSMPKFIKWGISNKLLIREIEEYIISIKKCF